MKWLSVQMFSDFLCVLIAVQINIQVLWELKARVTITTALVMEEFNKGRLSQYLPKFSLSRNMSGNAIRRHLLLSPWLVVVVTTLAPWYIIMREADNERCRTSNMKHCVSKIQTEAITVKKCRSAHCKLYTIQSLGADYKGRTQTVKGSQCQTLPLENNWISFDMLGHDPYTDIKVCSHKTSLRDFNFFSNWC